MTNPAPFDLVHESDRGCVLVGAAILEERLTELFHSVFERNGIPKKVQASIFDSNGPLSTFSSKIKMAYSLGYIGKPLYEDLDTVRRIRNEFAHTSKEVDFIGNAVSDTIRALHCVQQFKDALSRYSPSHQSTEPAAVTEASLRTAGFIKYTKSLFSLGVKTMEIELIKRTALVVSTAGA